MIATWPADARRGAVSVFCARHGLSRSRFYEIRALARAEGTLAAVAPAGSRRSRPDLATPLAVELAAVRIRKELAQGGWDCGPLSVRHQMAAEGIVGVPSRATLARIFTRYGLVVPQPQKRPRSSWRRFTFKFVHECWQLDATETVLADRTKAVVFQLLDDHSRYLVGSWVDTGETSAAAVAVFQAAVAAHQVPQLLLTDNGQALNPHRRGVTSQLATDAAALGTRTITSSVRHPQTLGKNERVHQTLKRWLDARPPAADVADLTALVAQFDDRYNNHRPHQALDMATPAHVLSTGPRAVPPLPPDPAPQQALQQRPPRPRRPLTRSTVKANGSVSARGNFIGLGVEHAGMPVLVLVENDVISLFDNTGTHLRTIQIQAGKKYYGTGRQKGGPRRPRPHQQDSTQQSGPNETGLSART